MSHLGVVSYVISANWQSGEQGQLILSLSPCEKHKRLGNLCYCRDRGSGRYMMWIMRHKPLGKQALLELLFTEQLFY